jgi:hypothetical protein
MPAPPFRYQEPFPLGEDETSYRLLTKDFVSTATFAGREILKVDPEALAYLAGQAMRDSSFLLRAKHLQQVAAILDDPQASANDRYVALTMLRNAEVSAEGILPFCQDTGTATVIAPAGLDRGERCRIPLQGHLQDLHRGESPLLADDPARHVRGDQLGHEPPGADRSLRHRGGEL